MWREGAEMGSCAEGFEFMIIIIIYLNDNIIAPLILPLNFRSISADQDGGDKVGLSGHVADRLRISVV